MLSPAVSAMVRGPAVAGAAAAGSCLEQAAKARNTKASGVRRNLSFKVMPQKDGSHPFLRTGSANLRRLSRILMLRIEFLILLTLFCHGEQQVWFYDLKWLQIC